MAGRVTPGNINKPQSQSATRCHRHQRSCSDELLSEIDGTGPAGRKPVRVVNNVRACRRVELDVRTTLGSSSVPLNIDRKPIVAASADSFSLYTLHSLELLTTCRNAYTWLSDVASPAQASPCRRLQSWSIASAEWRCCRLYVILYAGQTRATKP